MKLLFITLFLSLFNFSFAIPSIFNLQNYFHNHQHHASSDTDSVITSSSLGPAVTSNSNSISSSSSSSSFNRANKNRHAPVSVVATHAAKNDESGAPRRASVPLAPRPTQKAPRNGGPQKWLDKLISNINNVQSPFALPVDEPLEDISSIDTSQYEDDIVLRFSFSNIRELKAFKYAAETLVLDVWSINRAYGDIRISKSRLRDFLKLLPKSIRNNKIEVVSDVQMAVFSNYPLRSNRVLNDEVFFSDYRNLDQINYWIDSLPSKYNNISNTNVHVESIGLTHENRDIKMIHLTKQMIKPKSSIIVVSGIQGREWSSVMSTLYSISRILNNNPLLLEKYDFSFVPILNPDGFVYTWEYDRLWRKNRQPTGMSICSGIDIDHSFPYNWQQTPESTPCSETYGGVKSNEALESLHLSNYLNMTTKKINGYLQFGSYSQSILYPRGKNIEEYEESKDFAEDLLSTMSLEPLLPTNSESTSTSTSDISYLSTSITQIQPSDSSGIVNRQFSIGDLSLHHDGARGGSNVDLMKSKQISSLQITMPNYDDSGFLLPKKYILNASNEMYRVLKSYCELLSGKA